MAVTRCIHRPDGRLFAEVTIWEPTHATYQLVDDAGRLVGMNGTCGKGAVERLFEDLTERAGWPYEDTIATPTLTA